MIISQESIVIIQLHSAVQFWGSVTPTNVNISPLVSVGIHSQLPTSCTTVCMKEETGCLFGDTWAQKANAEYMNMPSLAQLTYPLTNFFSHSHTHSPSHSQTHLCIHTHTHTLRASRRSFVPLWAKCQCSQMALVEDEVPVPAVGEMWMPVRTLTAIWSASLSIEDLLTQRRKSYRYTVLLTHKCFLAVF